jgi:hypothetical protein
MLSLHHAYPTTNQSQDMDKASTCCLATHYYAIYSLPVTAISDSYIISMSSQVPMDWFANLSGNAHL